MTQQANEVVQQASEEEIYVLIKHHKFYLPSIVPAVIDGQLDRYKVRLVDAYSFTHPATLNHHIIPEGYTFDGASIPWWCWSALRVHPLSNRVLIAALVHDYLYEIRCNRKQADKLFMDLLIGAGMTEQKAKLFWSAVRAAGWLYY